MNLYDEHSRIEIIHEQHYKTTRFCGSSKQLFFFCLFDISFIKGDNLIIPSLLEMDQESCVGGDLHASKFSYHIYACS